MRRQIGQTVVALMTVASLPLTIATTMTMNVAVSTANAQETEAGTRQFAVAVGFQNQKLYDQAADEWQVFLKKFPQDPRVEKARHYLGTCHLQAKRYGEAVTAFESVLKLHPKFELLDQSLLNLGTAYYSVAQESKQPADYDKAERAFGRLIEQFPKSTYGGRAAFYRGESLYQQNKLREAAASYSLLISAFPKDDLAADAHYALGVTQEALKEPDAAQATFGQFAQKFPKHSLLTEVQMRQAEILFTKNDFSAAEKQFAQVRSVTEFALADTAMLRQARCLYELGKLEEAAAMYWDVPREFKKTKHYDTAVVAGAKCYFLVGKYATVRTGLEIVAGRNVPEAVEAKLWIARSYLKEKNAAAALKVLDQALEQHASSPLVPQLRLARIDTLYEIPERRKETVALYADYATKFPTDEFAAQAQYMAALTALDQDDHAAAKSLSNAFLTRHAKHKLLPDVLFIGAEARLLLREYAAAEAQYRDFLEESPKHANAPQARVRRALSLHLNNKHADAIKALEGVTAELKDPALQSEAFAVLGRCYAAQDKFEASTKSFESSLKAKPDREATDETLLALADAYRKLNQPEPANRTLQRLMRDFPNSTRVEEATFRLGEAAYASGAFDDAVTQYSAVVKNFPQGTLAPHAQFGLGWSHFKRNDFKSAVAAIGTLQTKYASSELATKGLYVRAMSRFQLGDHQGAVDDATAFLKSNPPKVDALDAQYLMGLSLAAQQKFAEAAKVYATILTTDPKYSGADKAAYELGWANTELGRQKEAVAAFRRLATDYPESPLAAESLFRVGEAHYEASEFSLAAKAYAEARQKAGTGEVAEKAAHKLGWSHLKADKFKEATEAFAAQVKSFPTGPLAGDAEFLLGECLFKQGDWKSAMTRYQTVAAAKNPTYEALALYRSGEAAASLEQWDASLKFHQRVLAEHPSFELRPEARYGVGWALQQQGKLAEAIEQFEKVTEETDTETAAKSRFMIGECYFAKKEHKEASKHFLKAAFAYSHKEWSAMSFFEAGRCFEVLRDVTQAKSCYQQLVEKYPSHPKVAAAKKRLSEL